MTSGSLLQSFGMPFALKMCIRDREKGIPYLGICLGMQIAVIEFARHAAGWADAHSAEFSAVTAHPYP